MSSTPIHLSRFRLRSLFGLVTAAATFLGVCFLLVAGNGWTSAVVCVFGCGLTGALLGNRIGAIVGAYIGYLIMIAIWTCLAFAGFGDFIHAP